MSETTIVGRIDFSVKKTSGLELLKEVISDAGLDEAAVLERDHITFHYKGSGGEFSAGNFGFAERIANLANDTAEYLGGLFDGYITLTNETGYMAVRIHGKNVTAKHKSRGHFTAPLNNGEAVLVHQSPNRSGH